MIKKVKTKRTSKTVSAPKLDKGISGGIKNQRPKK
jgi:hypothetical protein